MKIIALLILISILPSGYYHPEPEPDPIEFIGEKIAQVETGGQHYRGRSVITNYLGMVGENQIDPVTADFIHNKYSYSCDIAELDCNRKTRDDYLRWMLGRGMSLVEAINGYNVGHNSKWWNTNYIIGVLGNDYFLVDKKVVGRKKGVNKWLVKLENAGTVR
jgi:hypothetical protein